MSELTIGVAGLGLIGGSMAKTIKRMTNNRVLGFDSDPQVMLKAKLLEAVDGSLTEETLPECDMLIIALYPQDAEEYSAHAAPLLKKGAIVVDCCGVKRTVYDTVLPLYRDNGAYYIGGHPMAGLEVSGFDNSKKNLFSGASMILTPPGDTPIEVIAQTKKFFLDIGFCAVKMSDPDTHDHMIAFTSQLAHVVSSAYVKSPEAMVHEGFSAGSFQDMTRVAKLNEDLWTDLFFRNADYLSIELDALIAHLEQYAAALKNNDRDSMRELLKEGRVRREELNSRKKPKGEI